MDWRGRNGRREEGVREEWKKGGREEERIGRMKEGRKGEREEVEGGIEGIR